MADKHPIYRAMEAQREPMSPPPREEGESDSDYLNRMVGLLWSTELQQSELRDEGGSARDDLARSLPAEGQDTNAALPGWYPESERLDSLRYWDGTRWTDHRATRTTHVVQPPPPPLGFTSDPVQEIRDPSIAKRPRSRTRLVLLCILGVALLIPSLILAVIVVLGSRVQSATESNREAVKAAYLPYMNKFIANMQAVAKAGDPAPASGTQSALYAACTRLLNDTQSIPPLPSVSSDFDVAWSQVKIDAPEFATSCLSYLTVGPEATSGNTANQYRQLKLDAGSLSDAMAKLPA